MRTVKGPVIGPFLAVQNLLVTCAQSGLVKFLRNILYGSVKEMLDNNGPHSLMIAGGPYMAPPEKVPLKDVIVSFIKKEDAGIPEETPES